MFKVLKSFSQNSFGTNPSIFPQSIKMIEFYGRINHNFILGLTTLGIMTLGLRIGGFGIQFDFALNYVS